MFSECPVEEVGSGVVGLDLVAAVGGEGEGDGLVKEVFFMEGGSEEVEDLALFVFEGVLDLEGGIIVEGYGALVAGLSAHGGVEGGFFED